MGWEPVLRFVASCCCVIGAGRGICGAVVAVDIGAAGVREVKGGDSESVGLFLFVETPCFLRVR